MTLDVFQEDNEQSNIKAIYYAIKNENKHECETLIKKIISKYPNSYVLQYYAAVACKKLNDYNTAEQCYKKSIMINSFFAVPVLELAEFYISISRFAEAEKMLIRIFDKITLDPMSLTGEMVYNVRDNLRICSILGTEYLKSKNPEQRRKVVWLYSKMISRFKERGLSSYTDLEGWKNLCLGIGDAYMMYDTEKAHIYYALGLQAGYSGILIDKDYDSLFAKNELEIAMLLKLNKSLFQGLSLSAGYVLNPLNCMRVQWAKRLYPVAPFEAYREKEWSGNSILKVGLISPDFNKNAAGLFLTPILRDYDHDKMEVYCYYNNEQNAQFTEVFRKYSIASWVNIFNMTDAEVYSIMKNNHKLDVLIDCIGCGVGNRLDLLSMRPAQKIVSYVGFPDYTYVPAITHRISDKWCHNEEWENDDGEKVIMLKHTFSCYSLFDNIELPQLQVHERKDTFVKVGIVQKLSKWHPIVRSAWKEIFHRRTDFILYVKEEMDSCSIKMQKEAMKEILSDETRIIYIPFNAKLEGYLEGIGGLDFCLETYPYSGTTTTCSCLLMGVPVFTVEMGKRHCSRVTAGILREMGDMTEYICSSIEELIERVCKWDFKNIHRSKIRERFLEVMDSKRYMEDFYDGIVSIFRENTTLIEEQPSSSLKLLVQGWFDLPHSYTIVAVNHIACLIDMGVIVYLKKISYNNSSWKSIDLDNIVGDKVRKTFEKANIWKGESVDAILRIAFNDEPIEKTTIPIFWFYTSETQMSFEKDFDDFVHQCRLGNIIPVAPSEWSAKTYTPHRVKSVVIKHGIDPDIFNTIRIRRNETRKELEVSGCVFLHIGAMSGNRNVGGILKGFYDLVIGGADCYLILKGMEDLYRSREMVRSALSDNISKGKIEKSLWNKVKTRIKATYNVINIQDLADMYKACDVYIAPYIGEGFDMPVLEALSCGLDVVVSDKGPVKEWGIPPQRIVYINGQEKMTENGMGFISSDEDIYNGMLEGYNRWISCTKLEPFNISWKDTTKHLLNVITKYSNSHKYRLGLISGEMICEELLYSCHKNNYFKNEVSFTITEDDIAIVKGGDAYLFLKDIIPELDRPVVLVIHNSDENIDSDRYSKFLDHYNVRCCFAQNPEFTHPKLFGLPIGIANSGWEYGDMNAMAKVRSEHVSKTRLCYIGFDVQTNPKVRSECKSILENRFAWQDQYKFRTYEEYLRFLKGFHFCICPEGNGADTHRFWECLYLGVTPIVLKSSNIIKHCWGNKVHSALLVNTWNDVTETFLNEKQGNLQNIPPKLLELDYYCGWIRNRASVKAVVVLVYLGKELPEYIKYCVQSCLNLGIDKIYIYLDEAEWCHECNNIVIVKPTDIGEKSNMYKEFLEQHPFCLNKDMQSFRKRFWQKCLERFFVLYEVIKKYNLRDVVHLENDCLLFQDIWEILDELRKKEVWTVFMNAKRCAPRFFYVRDIVSISNICNYLLKCQESDMDILGQYALIYPDRVGRLPRVPSEMGSMPCVFDAAPLGQFIEGQYPRNGDGSDGFINQDADYKVDKWNIEYRDGGWWVNQNVKVGLLHVHSKDLKRFLKYTIVARPKKRFAMEEID